MKHILFILISFIVCSAADDTITALLAKKNIDRSDETAFVKILGFNGKSFFSDITAGFQGRPETYWKNQIFVPDEIQGYGDAQGNWRSGILWTVEQKMQSSKPLPGVMTHLGPPAANEIKQQTLFICSFTEGRLAPKYAALIMNNNNIQKNDAIETSYFQFIEIAKFKKLDGFEINAPVFRQISFTDKTIISAINAYSK